MGKSRTSLPLIVLGALLVVVATTIFSSTVADGPIEEKTSPAPAPSDPIGEREVVTPPRLEPKPSSSPSDDLTIDRAAVAPAADAEATDSRHGRSIEGTVVVVDDRQVEHATASGSLEAILIDESPTTGSVVQIPVRLGRFSFRAPSDTTKLHILRSTLDTRLAFCEEESVAIDDAPLALRFRFRGRTILRVRDEMTGADLTDVMLRCDSQVGESQRYEHPGLPLPATPLADHANSPIDITHRMGDGYRTTIYAHVPGYAWGHVDVDPREGGVLPILLRPGGRLVVRTKGSRPPATAFLRVRRDGASMPCAEANLSSAAEYDFDGMIPGEYRVTVESTPWWNDPEPLAAGHVALIAGATKIVELEIPAPSPITTVPLQGIVFLPREWKRRDFTLLVELVDHSRPRLVVGDSAIESFPDDPESFRFDAGFLVPGRYEIRVSPHHWVLVHDVGPTGDLACRIEIPPPTHVSVRALDALTGEPAKIAGITWSVPHPEVTTGGPLENVSRDPQSGRFEFDCATATIELQIWEDGYSFLNELHSLVPGTNEITVHLTPSCGLDLSLRCDGRPVLFPRGFDVELTPVSGTGEVVAASYNDERQRRVVDVPGRYRVTIPAIQGYLPVEPFELDIAPGKFVKHVIELRARP